MLHILKKQGISSVARIVASASFCALAPVTLAHADDNAPGLLVVTTDAQYVLQDSSISISNSDNSLSGSGSGNLKGKGYDIEAVGLIPPSVFPFAARASYGHWDEKNNSSCSGDASGSQGSGSGAECADGLSNAKWRVELAYAPNPIYWGLGASNLRQTGNGATSLYKAEYLVFGLVFAGGQSIFDFAARAGAMQLSLTQPYGSGKGTGEYFSTAFTYSYMITSIIGANAGLGLDLYHYSSNIPASASLPAYSQTSTDAFLNLKIGLSFGVGTQPSAGQ